jgi:hypothetical protein
VLVIWGAATLVPLAAVYLFFMRSPHSPKSKEGMIGKGEDWRDKTHFRFALGGAWADWLLHFPLFVSGSVGVLLGEAWGYMLFGAAGAISLYINIILWFVEKEYVYPSRGPLKYFTYYWGFFVYWGALALAYSALRVGGIEF